MDAFERAKRVALRMMRTRMWQKAIGEEDPMMVTHFPQLARINKLGMITINSQAGHVTHYKSVQTGKLATIAERAYCEGFVRPHEADEILRWMWAHTDKYAVKMQVGDDAVDDKVFADVGVFGVTTQDGGATWFTNVRPSGPASLRNENYPSSAVWESATREDRARARKEIGPSLAHPIPESAVCFAVCRYDHRPDRERAVGPVFRAREVLARTRTLKSHYQR
jgi:hypothetical protein